MLTACRHLAVTGRQLRALGLTDALRDLGAVGSPGSEWLESPLLNGVDQVKAAFHEGGGVALGCGQADTLFVGLGLGAVKVGPHLAASLADLGDAHRISNRYIG